MWLVFRRMEDPPTIPIALGLASVIILVLANAYFVAAEFALVGSRKTRIEAMIRRGDKKAVLAKRAITSLDKYISATQLGITISSIGLGWIGEPALAGGIEWIFAWLPEAAASVVSHGVAVAIAFAIISALHIILGELVPKALALLFPETISLYVSGPLIVFAWIMYVPIAVLNGTANWILRLFKIEAPHEAERLHSPEEIRMLVEQSQVGGSMERTDARLLEGVFEFSEKSAEDVMTPRTQVVALSTEQSLLEAADEVARTRRSRYPVYTTTLDEVVGMVHAKDILTALRSTPEATVGTIMRPPIFVPGTREVEDVLADMKRLKSHLAIVLDEYGGTAGLVTMEDLLEEIVGPIYDEHDRQVKVVAPSAGSAPLVDGSMPIHEFNAAYRTDFDDTDYTTVGGLLFGQLGRLPEPGDRVNLKKYVFEIEEMDGRRVKSVRVFGTAGAKPG